MEVSAPLVSVLLADRPSLISPTTNCVRLFGLCFPPFSGKNRVRTMEFARPTRASCQSLSASLDVFSLFGKATGSQAFALPNVPQRRHLKCLISRKTLRQLLSIFKSMIKLISQFRCRFQTRTAPSRFTSFTGNFRRRSYGALRV